MYIDLVVNTGYIIEKNISIKTSEGCGSNISIRIYQHVTAYFNMFADVHRQAAGSFFSVQKSVQTNIGIMSVVNATRICQLMPGGFL